MFNERIILHKNEIIFFPKSELYSVHSENAEIRFLLLPSGTCFRSCFDKSCIKQGASTASSNYNEN